MSINERVKLLREALGKSQEHFGTAIGISKSGVSNIESGIRSVTEKHIKLICVAFPVNESWLRTGEGEMFSAANNSDDLEQLLASLSDDELIKRIIRSYLSLDRSGKIALQKLIDSFSVSGSSGTPAAPALSETTTSVPDTSGQERTEPDLAAKVAELERQNQELAAKVAAMEEEDALLEPMDASEASPSVSAGTFSPRVKNKPGKA